MLKRLFAAFIILSAILVSGNAHAQDKQAQFINPAGCPIFGSIHEFALGLITKAEAQVIPCQGGGGGGAGCPTSATFLARTSGLSGTETAAYQNFICGAVSEGLWSSFDIVQVYWTNTTTTANLNLVSTSFSATNHGATFTADRGYSGNAASLEYVDTGFAPSLGTQEQINSAHYSAYMQSAGGITTGTSPIFYIDGTTGYGIYADFTDGNTYMRINDNPETSGFVNTVGSQLGFWLGNRSGATARQGYMGNANSIGTYGSSPAVSSLSATHILLLSSSSVTTVSSPGTIGMFTAGGSLTPTQVSQLFTLEQAFCTAVGACTPPPTCSNKFDFSVSCNSQYLAIGGIF